MKLGDRIQTNGASLDSRQARRMFVFRPKRGLFYLILGLPVFMAMKFGMDLVFGASHITPLKYAILMAVLCALLATFTNLLEKK
ncbi:hypothetical protein [Sphingomonas sp.]|jgi:hypothetical protein|uniref:hypothetical protein n=1 Tax=Sphingomonas sp. TaxID=28214 RepID=UPI00307D917D